VGKRKGEVDRRPSERSGSGEGATLNLCTQVIASSLTRGRPRERPRDHASTVVMNFVNTD